MSLVRLMTSEDDVIGPVNLGNPGEFTIKELAEIVIEMTGSSSKINYEPLPADDPTQRQPDIGLIRDKLGWEPVVKLRDGLKKTIEYFGNLDLSHFRMPTDHTAHKSSELQSVTH